MKKLISFENFKKQTINENIEDTDDRIEEIIPEGPLDDTNMDTNMGNDEKVDQISDFLDSEPSDDIIEEIVNILRDGLTEMEQMGFVEPEVIDDLDDEHDGDWISWCKEVIQLPDFFEEGLDNVLNFIENLDEEEFGQIDGEGWGEEYGDDVECPDCDGTGKYENGEECERCDGEGRVDRPYDIPPDN